MKKRMLLVLPKNFAVDFGSTQFAAKYLKKGTGGVMDAALATIAALTPLEEFDIEIVDEGLETIPFDTPYDLVGITAIITLFGRAIEIAAEFRRRGVLVVCGGSSVSLSPERWRPHADVLIIGEAERIWPEFVADYLAGKHRSEYRETERFDLDISPVPNYSFLSEKAKRQYMMGIVQTSRGCPYNCEFCDVITYVGRKMRYKPLDTVMREVEQIKRIGIGRIFLADDNFSANREKAKEILRALRDWNRRQSRKMSFSTQVSIDTAQDDELLHLAGEANLLRVCIGIESPNAASLREAKKLHNVKSDMIRDIRKFHQYGIQVTGSTIVGFDNDDLSIFQLHLDFQQGSGISGVIVHPLQAPDGSALKQRLIAEGRYRDPEKYCEGNLKFSNKFNTFTVIPKQMTIPQLRQGWFWLLWRLYLPENLLHRVETFFNNFDSSPFRETLELSKMTPDYRGLSVLLKLVGFYVRDASSEEKGVIKRLFRRAWRSTHPQRFFIAIGSFVMMKAYREMLRLHEPHIEEITCPTATEPESVEPVGQNCRPTHQDIP